MKKRDIVSISLCALLIWSLQSYAQLTPKELSERAKWEEFLRKAKVVSSENLGEGVTKPKKFLLRRGTDESNGVWKSPSAIDAGKFDKWECEIAAYRLDKLLGLGMIPPTVERRFRGRLGSLQLWVTLEISELKRKENNIPIPPEYQEQLTKTLYIQRAFDSLIANSDRTLQNLQYTKDWRVILFDHSRSFRSTGEHTKRLIYGKYGMRPERPFLQLPRTFVDRIRSLTFDKIRRAVEFYLTYDEIEAVLKRRDLIIKEVDEMIRERGEDAVLY
jgi:hypothetical protein